MKFPIEKHAVSNLLTIKHLLVKALLSLFRIKKTKIFEAPKKPKSSSREPKNSLPNYLSQSYWNLMIEDIRNDKEAFKRTQEPGLYAYITKPKMGHGYSNP